MSSFDITKDAHEEELICLCGDPESQHVDGCEQCFIPGCGCKEFEEKQI